MSNLFLATKTLEAIENSVKADQGSAYRGWLGKVIPHIGDAYRTDEDGFRSHMGASVIGGECARNIWYSFHWSLKSSFEGRIIRLFNRGHLEEARFIAILLSIGCQFFQQDEQGKQFRISDIEGHFGGSGDGIVVGLPDLPPNTTALAEFKTHGEKSFVKLEKEGVRSAKFEHYVQVNIYMYKMGIPIAFYLAVNKNTDHLYGEFLPLDASIARQFIDRAAKIIWTSEIPERINNSPGFYKCKFCDHNAICHSGRAPEVNCRTCQYSEPCGQGMWLCSYITKTLNKEEQLVGCKRYKVKDVY